VERLQGCIQEVWFSKCNELCSLSYKLWFFCNLCLLGIDVSVYNYMGRYASLYFCMCIDADDNELEILEIIHHFVEILDRYFGSVSASMLFRFLFYYFLYICVKRFLLKNLFTLQVCELDLIFNFHKVFSFVSFTEGWGFELNSIPRCFCNVWLGSLFITANVFVFAGILLTG
jgi:hypothetical protein